MTRAGATLPAWHRRVPRAQGWQRLVEKGNGGAGELELFRLRPDAGAEETLAFPGREAAIVLLDGKVRFGAGAASHEATRGGPFAGPASALFLPAGATATLTAMASGCELLVVTAEASAGGEPRYLAPDDVEVVQRGADRYQREVHNILVSDAYASRLLVGETFNPSGGWSSYPPHKHDGEDGEPFLEEVYYYRVDPPQGFGFQGVYAKDGQMDQAARVQDGDAALIQRGYHPVAAAPGYRLYYFWALAGEQRRLVVFEDDAHAWTGR